MKNLFSLSDDKLKILLDAYSAWCEQDEEELKYPIEFRERAQELKDTLLNADYLSKVPDQVLKDKIFEYSRTLEGPAHIRLGMPRITGELEKIKRNLSYLIDSPDDPFKKAERILGGDYRIPIFAKAFWSPIFQAQYPEKLPNWNNKSEKFLKKVGFPLSSSKLTIEGKI